MNILLAAMNILPHTGTKPTIVRNKLGYIRVRAAGGYALREACFYFKAHLNEFLEDLVQLGLHQ